MESIRLRLVSANYPGSIICIVLLLSPVVNYCLIIRGERDKSACRYYLEKSTFLGKGDAPSVSNSPEEKRSEQYGIDNI